MACATSSFPVTVSLLLISTEALEPAIAGIWPIALRNTGASPIGLASGYLRGWQPEFIVSGPLRPGLTSKTLAYPFHALRQFCHRRHVTASGRVEVDLILPSDLAILRHLRV